MIWHASSLMGQLVVRELWIDRMGEYGPDYKEVKIHEQKTQCWEVKIREQKTQYEGVQIREKKMWFGEARIRE